MKYNLYYVSVILHHITEASTQFLALEKSIDDAQTNYAPFMDLISADVGEYEDSKLRVVYTVGFYIAEPEDIYNVLLETIKTIRDFSLPKCGVFHIQTTETTQITRQMCVDGDHHIQTEWIKSIPFSSDRLMPSVSEILGLEDDNCE